jgi:hypothetical protein
MLPSVGGDIPVRVAGHGDATSLRGVLELPVAAALGHLAPAVPFKSADNLSDLHRGGRYVEGVHINPAVGSGGCYTRDWDGTTRFSSGDRAI